MKHCSVLACLLLFGLTASLIGCGDDPPRSQSRGVSRAKASKKSKTSKGAKGPAYDQSLLPTKLRNIDWSLTDDLARAMTETRDPFRPYMPDLVIEAEDEGNAALPVTQIKTTISDSAVTELHLIAIITGTAVHKAMVTDGRGLGHIVRQGDIVGRKPPMRVMRITRNEVVFRALQAGPNEKAPREVRKALLTQEQLQELQP